MSIFFNARRWFASQLRPIGLSATLALCVGGIARAQDAGGQPVPFSTAMTTRTGGVIEDSYYYHRQGPMRSAIEAGGIPQANGWYEYGFPMRSYRYGWFGAERQYPRVIWHDGYYGDCIRTAYRGY